MRRFLCMFCVLLAASCAAAVPRTEVPAKPQEPLFTFVFDDGNDTDYLVARDIFAAQGAVACTAITTDLIGTPYHLNPDQIVALRDAGWEIMSHTVSHPNLRSLNADRIDAELSQSKAALEGLGVTVDNIVYPYNKNNELVRQIARKYYRSGRGGTNAANRSGEDPYYLKSYSNKHDLARMERAIDRAHAAGDWIIVYQHEVDIKAALAGRKGRFVTGETLQFEPSGAVGRYETSRWFLFFGSLYVVPLSGKPARGDRATGQTSGATARIDHIEYDDQAQIGEMLRYVRTTYPDMKIVTVDQGLDARGVPRK